MEDQISILTEIDLSLLKLHNLDSFLSKSDFTTSPFIIIPACGRIMITNFTSMLMLGRSIKNWDGKWQNRFKENSSFPTIQTNNICDLCMWWYLALHRKGLQIYKRFYHRKSAVMFHINNTVRLSIFGIFSLL